MTLRELKYVILGDDKLSDKFSKISGASDKASRAIGNHSDKLSGLKTKFMEATNAVPQLGGAMGSFGNVAAMAVNPITLAATAVVALGAAFNKAANASDEFNPKFRELMNINLDKTDGQLSAMKQKILDIASANGFDPSKTSKAYFDAESLLGVSGKPIESLITKVGKFSQVFQSDFNTTITGVSKAVKNFGLSLNQVDQYLASSQRTVSTALLTYNELATLQPVFAGSAKAAYQSFDSANQLFAVFSTMGKSADESATLVKSAFTDLFKGPTVKAFETLGIKLFKNGIPKQIPQIITELNAAFVKASKNGGAQAMNNLKNQFSGSEGINTLLAIAMDTTGTTLKTLKGYAGAATDYHRALALSNKDLVLQKEIIDNQLKVALTTLGDSLTPLRLGWTRFKQDLVDSLNIITSSNKGKTRADIMIRNMRDSVINNPKYQIDAMTEEQKKALLPELRKGYQKAVNDSRTQKGIDFLRNNTGLMQGYNDLIMKIYGGKDPIVNASNPYNYTPGSGSGTDTNIKTGLEGVSGGGTRNVTVTFKNLVENFNVNTTNLTDASGKIKNDIEEILVRAVSGAEQTIGAN